MALPSVHCARQQPQACAFATLPTILEVRNPMIKTTISLSTPAELETEALVAVVLDHANSPVGDKDKKPELKVATTDQAVNAAASDLLASGELNGQIL